MTVPPGFVDPTPRAKWQPGEMDDVTPLTWQWVKKLGFKRDSGYDGGGFWRIKLPADTDPQCHTYLSWCEHDREPGGVAIQTVGKGGDPDPTYYGYVTLTKRVRTRGDLMRLLDVLGIPFEYPSEAM